MKEIKAYIHRDRVADVISALKNSTAWGGEQGDARHNLAAYLVRGLVASPVGAERHYSVDLGDEVINEFKLELICPDEEAEELVRVIAANARTGDTQAGWITVAELVSAAPIR